MRVAYTHLHAQPIPCRQTKAQNTTPSTDAQVDTDLLGGVSSNGFISRGKLLGEVRAIQVALQPHHTGFGGLHPFLHSCHDARAQVVHYCREAVTKLAPLPCTIASKIIRDVRWATVQFVRYCSLASRKKGAQLIIRAFYAKACRWSGALHNASRTTRINTLRLGLPHPGA